MLTRAFPGLTEGARLWVYGFSKALTAADADAVRAGLSDFVAHWTSHDRPVRGAFEIVHGRFSLIAAETPGGVSGCSIDKSVALFKSLEARGLDALDRGLVFFRDNKGAVQACGRPEFGKLSSSGQVGPGTRVFDLTLQTVGQYRAGLFEVPLEKSWHARVFASSHA